MASKSESRPGRPGDDDLAREQRPDAAVDGAEVGDLLTGRHDDELLPIAPRHDRAVVAGFERPHLPVDGTLRAVLIDHRRAADRVDGDERRRLREVRQEVRVAEINRHGIHQLWTNQRLGRAAVIDGEHIDTHLARSTDGELRHDGGARRHFDREQLRQSRIAPHERLGAAEPVGVVGVAPAARNDATNASSKRLIGRSSAASARLRASASAALDRAWSACCTATTDATVAATVRAPSATTPPRARRRARRRSRTSSPSRSSGGMPWTGDARRATAPRNAGLRSVRSAPVRAQRRSS